MDTSDIDKAQGHWLLAKMGKRVLRPGGKELTQKLIDSLEISKSDHLVEFAPGMGKTASFLIKKTPKAYIGVDADEDAVKRLGQKLKGKNVNFILANAASTTLESNSVDKVVGEAMLTMHADHRKSEIIREAYRILKVGGLYGIHEMGLAPNGISQEIKTEISKQLAISIHVNARPLTVDEWKSLLEAEGFKIRKVETNGMLLLEAKRVLKDEGLLRTLKIGFNVMTHPKVKKRLLDMRKVFRKHEHHLNSVAIIAEKL